MNKHEPGSPKLAKLFRNGRSQAVRLPKEFRFEGETVRIRRQGEAVILEPVKPPAKDEWAWLKDLDGGFDEEVMRIAEEDVPWGPDDPEYHMTK